ncbi:homeobox protein engrailed-1-like [Corvus hawaiiensis]|uniref:homeobox protein engrailed-1-like n=1 Tax=Corvus hawaiiensis TaxID=134902 RepID=UPI002019F35C|nr:homeobox protein engrailed-1-like [Corvus hawaiiensis]
MKDFPEIRGKHRPRPPHWQPRTTATAPASGAPSPPLGAGDASVPQAHAAVAGGRDTRSGGGRGIPAAAPAVPGNKATGGGGGGGGSRKRAQPQEPAGSRADGAPRKEPGLRPVAHPPWHLPTQAVRAILNTHTDTRARARERGFRCQRQQAATEPALRRRSSGSSGRGTHTRKHTHPRTAGQAEMCISEIPEHGPRFLPPAPAAPQGGGVINRTYALGFPPATPHTAPRRGAAAARWAGAAPPRIRRGRWEILITDDFILHNYG